MAVRVDDNKHGLGLPVEVVSYTNLKFVFNVSVELMRAAEIR